jgi:hypothetical protein
MKSANGVQRTASWIIAVFAIASVVAYFISPSITEWSKTAGLWSSLIVYILTNPVYLTLIYWLSDRYHIMGFLSSLLVVLALDIQSLPHVIADGTNVDPNTYLFIDSIIFRNFGIQGIWLYFVLPTAMIIIAYEMVSPGTFVRIFKKHGI